MSLIEVNGISLQVEPEDVSFIKSLDLQILEGVVYHKNTPLARVLMQSELFEKYDAVVRHKDGSLRNFRRRNLKVKKKEWVKNQEAIYKLYGEEMPRRSKLPPID